MKCIILAAGKGERFNPATKYISKEMLPIGNRPALDIIMDEVNKVADPIIVTHKSKYDVIKYCEENNLRIAYQKERYGHIDAIYSARKYINKDDYLSGLFVILADTLIFQKENPLKLLLLSRQYDYDQVVGISEVEEKEASSYGIVWGEDSSNNEFWIRGIEEKPEHPNSNWALNGRYLLNWRSIENAYKCNFNLVNMLLLDLKGRLIGVKMNRFFDIGTPKRYYKVLNYYYKGEM